ncbi:DUF4282 domain-containing protein [Rhodopirellula bahusiensis]|uniref:GYF domain-containing protein n=1 Tax=Rhodopirellula bahusiensis TaxID=2014065 RepID=A0A2G1W827_9BACT|nr:DUF4282 domain-containing protein [Rhodopirellula bahusiensis]PHQ35176.1 hypothetical protein CEE69_12255 [Rhodopirellula bahusiensis]
METISGWLLRHHDKIEHGPFSLAVLVEAASRGDIVFDSEVKHDKHTEGQWILAKRVRQIREVMPASEPPPTSEPEPEEPIIDRETKPDFQLKIEPGRPGGKRIKLAIPRDPLSAFITIFDFRFNSFATPWIIRFIYGIGTVTIVLATIVFWGGAFIGSAIELMKFAIGGVAATDVLPKPYLASASIGQSLSFVENGGGGYVGASMPGNAFGIILTIIIVNLFFVIPLLILRVACEFMIVAFRVAEDVSDSKTLLRELFDRDA